MSNHFKIIHYVQGKGKPGTSLQLVLCLNSLEQPKKEDPPPAEPPPPKFAILAPEIQVCFHIGVAPGSPRTREPMYKVKQKYVPTIKNDRPLGGQAPGHGASAADRDNFNMIHQSLDLPRNVQFWPIPYLVDSEIPLDGCEEDEIHLAIRVMHVSRFQMCRHFRILVREVANVVSADDLEVVAEWYTPPIKVIAKATAPKERRWPTKSEEKKRKHNITTSAERHSELEMQLLYNSSKMIRMIEDAEQVGNVSDAIMGSLEQIAINATNVSKRLRISSASSGGLSETETAMALMEMASPVIKSPPSMLPLPPRAGDVVWVRYRPLECFWPCLYYDDTEGAGREGYNG
jgi:hypothetical protein